MRVIGLIRKSATPKERTGRKKKEPRMHADAHG
jgi:hypothetical protein